MTHLKLAEFREAYRSISKGLPIWAKHLVLGFLVWLETKYIDAKVKAELDRAEAEYWRNAPPSPPSTPTGHYSERGSSFWDEMSITTIYHDPRTIETREAPEGSGDR